MVAVPEATPVTRPVVTSTVAIPVALLLGSEKDGLTNFWLQGADEKISIPQAGLSDSLNVSNAAAICLFEAVRQRRK